MSRERLLALREEINLHNKLYYQDDAPQITDSEYDKLFRELLELEAQFPEEKSIDSPALKIGSAPLSSFERYYHRYKMYSLNNAMNDTEFSNFFETVTKVELTSLATPSVVMEYKFDGLALELVYRDGVLVEASTRGDGEIGELVTENVRTIRNLPLVLGPHAPKELIVYGEAVMLKKEFEALNVKRRQHEEKEFANPRNAAAGSIRLLDSRQTAERKLYFYAYDCKTEDTTSLVGMMNLHTHRMDELKRLGLMISPVRKIIHPGNLHEAFLFYREVQNQRPELPFEIDGVVVKVVMDEIRDILGYSDRAPKWAIAWKFEAEEVTTTLLNIEYEVGRTGALTPVAVLEPVELAGTTISRASLHNFDYITEKDFYLGDKVVIKRAGDVIPFVVRSVLEARTTDAVKIEEPKECPICYTPPIRDLSKDSQEMRVLRCPNTSCEGRIRARLKYFVSKQGLDIEGFGERLVDTLFEAGFLGSKENSYMDSFAAIFALKTQRDTLLTIEGLGDKSVDMLLAQIESRKKSPLTNFIRALGIRSVGSVTSSKLTKKFHTFDAMIKAYDTDGEEYQKIEKIHKYRNSIQAFLEQREPLDKKDAPLKEELKQISEKLAIAKESNNSDVYFLVLEKQKLEAEREVIKPMKKECDNNISKLRQQETELVKKLALGVNISEEIIKFCVEKRSQKELEYLHQAGFEILEEKKQSTAILAHPLFEHKRVLITGKSKCLGSRQEIKEFLQALGAEIAAGITKNTDYLITCEKPSSEKVKKAIDFNIKIITEEQFFAMLDHDVLEKFRNLFAFFE